MDIQNVIHQEIVVNCQNARRNQFFSTKKMNKKSWFQVRVDCRSGMSFAFWVFIDKTTFAPSYTSVFTPIFSELSRRSNLMDGWADLCCWLTYTFNIPVKSRHYVNDGGYLIPSGRRWTTGWAVNTSSINVRAHETKYLFRWNILKSSSTPVSFHGLVYCFCT